jgi:hypothetical protein
MNTRKTLRREQTAEPATPTGMRWRNAAYVGVSAALIFTVVILEAERGTGQLEFLIVLAGPLLTGIVMRLRGWPWRLGAAAWALNGLAMLAYDWALNNEDQAYHAGLALVMAALVALGAALGHGVLAVHSQVRTKRPSR